MDPLVEVFSVHVFIDGVDDPSSADIEGEFKVYDHYAEHFDLYKRVEGSPSVLPDGTLSLVAPPRCLTGPNWGFNLHLKDKRRNLEICSGGWDFGSNYYSSNDGPPLTTVVFGEHGYALVNHVVYEMASQATIEVFVDALECKGVHGLIHAKNKANNATADTCFEEVSKLTLFQVPKEKPQMLKDGTNKIALSRSCVVVPAGLDLIVEAKLFKGGCALANGFASFEEERSGTVSQRIGGITVKVSWYNDPFEAVGLPHLRMNLPLVSVPEYYQFPTQISSPDMWNELASC